jgi:outer membrane receptor protein involved in Fe transport
MKKLFRFGVLPMLFASSVQAQPQVHNFDIPAEAAVLAIPEFARQADLQIIAPAEKLAGLSTAALKGALDSRTALGKLLAGTPLEIASDDGTIIVLKVKGDKLSARDTNGLGLEEVVVTGNSEGIQKFKAPYAISTLDEATIQERAPRSLVDLLKSVPGIGAENSGGEGGGENIVIRGLPFAGFRLIDVLEDGVPLFESNYERELNIDEVFRVDLNTTRAEIVRGGTAPIYSNNASGGVVNFITNHGTSTPQNEIQVTTGPNYLGRADFELSGPATDKLLYSASGFFRRDDGLRNPGFSGADQGGQFKLGGTYLLDNGKVYADFKYLNDRSIFYSDIPLTNPVTGESLKGLIDPSYGTLDSGALRHEQILVLDGNGHVASQSHDLANGIHPETKTVTLGGDFSLGDGWAISDKARYVDGTVGFDGIYNGSPADATANLAGYLKAAQGAFAGTTSLRYVIAGTNTPFNPASTAGLTMTNTWESTTSSYTDAINDLRVTKSIDSALGKHDLTAGFYISAFSFNEQQIGSTILTNVKNQPDALDVQALGANGAVLGTVTQNGFTAFGSGDLIGRVNGVSKSFYGAENWQITPDWQADAGIRREIQTDSGARGIIGTQTVATTGSLASRSVTGLIGWRDYEKQLNGTSWTVGTSYQILDPLNGFVRYSDTYSPPRLSDQWGNINNGVAGTLPNGQPVPTTPIKQAEAGLKFSVPTLQLFAIGFWSHFDNLNASTYVTNSAGILQNSPLLIDTTTSGVEFEEAWRPLSSFELNGSVTLQKPVITSATTFSTTVTGSSLDNKAIPRVPNYTLTIQPAYLFDFGQVTGRAFASFYAIGKRYQDFINTSVLPAYETVDVGVTAYLGQSWRFQMLGSNLANSAGLTEGNARAPVSNVITTADATTGRPIFGRTFTATASYSW